MQTHEKEQAGLVNTFDQIFRNSDDEDFYGFQIIINYRTLTNTINIPIELQYRELVCQNKMSFCIEKPWWNAWLLCYEKRSGIKNTGLKIPEKD